jgi:hypothetical protein
VDKKVKKHWRRIEVLLIIFVLLFVPGLFLTFVVPAGPNSINAPLSVALGTAPVVVAWILLELVQLLVVVRRDDGSVFGSAARANLYFFAWVAYIGSALFLLYAAFGDIEWLNYFYESVPPLLRIGLVGFAALLWLKLTPVIFYKRSKPFH